MPKEAYKRFLLEYLGCRVNQAEASSLKAELIRRGHTQATEGVAAELVILMTCSVTAAAGRQSRQAARKLAKAHPDAEVVISGCDLQANSGPYRDEGFSLLPRAELWPLPEIFAVPEVIPPADTGQFCPGMVLPDASRTRGMLKVQDGCDAFCAYCIVPYTRGAPRSLPLSQAQEQYQRIIAAGAREIVLTGIHLGRWGHDFTPPADLADLVAGLLGLSDDVRLRLSSLESAEVSPRLLEIATQSANLCRHFHLPLQSGCDRVLQAMERPQRTADYEATMLSLYKAIDGVCLGADVLMGLPGEDEAAFRETYDLLESLPISYLHVFPYSPRPGTKAATMPGQVHSHLAKERAAKLRELAVAKRHEYLKKQVGEVLEIIVERPGLGRSDNYCLVEIDPSIPRGEVLMAEISGVGDYSKGLQLKGNITF